MLLSLIIIFFLNRQVQSSCTYYTYEDERFGIGIVQTKQYNFKMNEMFKLGIGFWISYRPIFNQYLEENPQVNAESNKKQFYVFSFRDLNLENFSILFYIEILLEEKLITHNMILETNGGRKLQTQQMVYDTYEGSWIFVYILNDETQQQIIINYYTSNSQYLVNNILNGALLFGTEMKSHTGGYYNLLNDINTLYLQGYPGYIQPVILKLYDYFTNQVEKFLEDCFPIDACYSEEINLVSYNTSMPDNLISFDEQIYTRGYFYQQYILQGWIKQDELINSMESTTLLLRITVNEYYLDDQQMGDRLLYIEYYQNQINLEQNGFKLQTYSYTIPWVSDIYASDDSDVILVLGKKYKDLLTKWHYFQFEVGTNNNNGQPLYTVYYAGIDYTEQYVWQKQINHFKASTLYFQIGVDDYSNYFNGLLSDWKLNQICETANTQFIPNCHYSCLKCNGISQLDCTSCSSENLRKYSESQKICKCQRGYLDTQDKAECQELNKHNAAFEIFETEIIINKDGSFYENEKEMQCNFGYFKYNNSCIQCPYMPDNQLLLCADCLLFPDFFSQTLNCTFKLSSSSKDSVFFYSSMIDLYSMQETIEQEYKIILRKGNLENQKCKNGFFLTENNDCQECPINCIWCTNQFSCWECASGYEFDSNGFCVFCDICAQMIDLSTEEGTIIIYNCQPKQFLFWNLCFDCGSHCQQCSIEQCFYCEDNKKYFITLDKWNCAYCPIEHCQYCFQFIMTADQTIITSLDFNTYFELQYSEIMTGCALCEDNYFYSLVTLTCELKPLDVIDCQYGVYTDNLYSNQCLISYNRQDSIQQSICNDQLCLSCINNYSDQISSFCIICQDGYYSSYQSGKCLKCPQNCATCSEYNIKSNDYWKQNIRAFYHFFINQNRNHYFEYYQANSLQVTCLSCQSNYFLLNQQCEQGCSEDCVDCQISIDYQQKESFKCNTCLQDAFNNQRSVYQNEVNKCLTCPDQCEACLPRSSDQITAINPFFDQTSSYLKYSHICYKYQDSIDIVAINKSQFTVKDKCLNFKYCYKLLSLSLYSYCDSSSWGRAVMQEEDEGKRSRYIEFDSIILLDYVLPSFQTQDIIEYSNQVGIVELTYNLEMIYFQGDYVCSVFNETIKIFNSWKKDVFTLKRTNLVFWNSLQSDTDLIPLLLIAEFTLINFDKITFKGIQFITFEEEYYLDMPIAKVQFNNEHDPVTIIFENCEIILPYWGKEATLTFTSNNPKQLIIKSLNLTTLAVYNSSIFDFQPSGRQFNSYQDINQLLIKDSKFTNTTLFLYNADKFSLSQVMNISKVTILNSNFSASYFINSSFIFDYKIGELYIQDVYLENIIASNNSIIFNVLNAKQLIVNNLTIKNGLFLDESSLFICNIMKLEGLLILDSYINLGFFIDISHKIKSNRELITNEISISQVSFINNTYQKSKSFIRVLQDEFTKIIFRCNDLLLDNNSLAGSVQGITSFNYVSYKYSLIFIDCTLGDIQNVQIQRGIGLPEISIINSESLIINNFYVETKSKYYQRFLHSSLECATKFNYLDLTFVLYIQSYINLELDNIIVQNTIVIDHQLISIIGKNSVDSFQSEIILLKNSIFRNNLLLIMNENKRTSLFLIETEQDSKITINNVQFINNFFNQFHQNIQKHSSTTLLINSEQGQIFIQSSQFINNTITNSSDSILYFLAKKITIQDCIFLNQNILTSSFFLKNIISIKNHSLFNHDIEQSFQVLANGGNGYFQALNLSIINTIITNSVAVNGGGFYIVLISEGIIYVSNSTFNQTQTLLNGNQLASGGFLYIDSSQSLLNLQVVNCSIQSAYSRTQGGAIYIDPSKSSNFIYLDSLNVKSVFSIQHSFLSFSPSKQISIESQIIISNSQFENTEQDFNNFGQNLSDLQEQNLHLFQTSNPLIYVQFSSFNMINCKFENIHLISILEIEQGININIQKLNILNSTIFQSSILKLSLRTDTQGHILLQNIFIYNLKEYNFKNQLDCVSFEQNYLKLLCPTILSDLNKEPQIIYNDKNLENQLNCNLNMLYSAISTLSFGLFELNNFNSNHFILIDYLGMSNIQCLNCYFGIFSVKKFDSELQLQQKNLIFQNNQCGVLGCFSIIKTVENILANQILQTPLDFTKTNYKILLINSIFQNNIAQYGGACFLSEIDILINNTIFENNQAKLFGGSIYYQSNKTTLMILNSQIILNSAEIGGGIYLDHQQLQNIEKLNSFIQDNDGKSQASNIYETPRFLYLSLDKVNTMKNVLIFRNSTTICQKVQINSQYSLDSKTPTDLLILPTGISISDYKYFNHTQNSYIPFNLSFRLQTQNTFGEIIQDLENSYCYISAVALEKTQEFSIENLIFNSSLNQFISKTTVTFNMQTHDYNLDDLIIYFNPYSNQILQLSFLCDSIELPVWYSQSNEIQSIIKNNLLILNIRTFECQLGEFFNQSSGGCVLCDISQNQYSVNLNATFCSIKDETKIESIEPAMIKLRSSYWRAFYYSSQIEECLNLLANCKGGWLAGNPSCAIGHIGALCEQCDLYNMQGQGFYSSNQSYQCSNCDQSSQNILNILLVILWTFVSVFITVTSTIRMIDDFLFQLKLKPLGFFTVIQSASTSVLLKVFTNYLQIISSIASFQLQIPIGIVLAIRGVGNPIGSMAFSLDCYLYDASRIPMLYFRIIWGFAMAGIYIFLFFLFHLIASFIDKRKLNITFVSTTLIYLYIYLSPNIVSELSFLISYRNISGQKWIASNVAYLYNTAEHKQWLIFFVTPAFLIIGILLPMFFWYIVYHHRFSLNTFKTKRIWGYLYNEYRLSTYYWETIKIIQKELIILILIYYEDYVAIKACLIFFLLHIYSKLTIKFKPYLTKSLNQIDSLSTSICKLSIVLAQSIYLAQSLTIIEVIWPFYIVLTLINLYFIVQMIIKLIFAYFEKLYEHIDKVKAIVFYYLPRSIQKKQFCLNIFRNTTVKKQTVRKRFQLIRRYLINQAKLIITFKKQNNMGLQKIDHHGANTRQNTNLGKLIKLHTITENF